MANKNYWDLEKRPHTKLKLEIYKQYIDIWCSIFKNQPHYKEVYIVDCFAGRGEYSNKDIKVDGSPLIAVKTALKYQELFLNGKEKNKDKFKINCIFIDDSKSNVENLRKVLLPYENKINFEIIENDFNVVIEDVVKKIGYKPALFFIDPYGIKGIKKESILLIVNKKGAKDILFNYIHEGVVRIRGLANKCLNKNPNELTTKEIKTINNLFEFIGGDECARLIGEKDVDFLKSFVEKILKSNNKNFDEKNNLNVIAFDMPYPNKSDTIYYLIFASRNNNAIKIVRQVYAKSKQTNFHRQSTFFDVKTTQKSYKNFDV